MNKLPEQVLQRVNREAIYNLYLYLADTPTESGQAFHSVISETEKRLKKAKNKSRDIYRLNIIKNALSSDPLLSLSSIGDFIRLKSSSTVCTFINPNGEISVVFKGTGNKEWLDNGEGLSGMPEENTYAVYANGALEPFYKTVTEDYATDRQAEALNLFNSLAAKYRWDKNTSITLSGHSKGGNKAQFVAIHSDLVDRCYSFDGQGFSPEAIMAMQRLYKSDFNERTSKILSLSADNDYVNVLGERLMKNENIYYFKSEGGLHYMEAILDPLGKLKPETEQGNLSRYIEGVSRDLMDMPPHLRRYATVGVMNIVKKYLGSDTDSNGKKITDKETLAGIMLSCGALLSNLRKNKFI